MALTPMMQQYFQIKDRYKECILFFRLGDFYEMFFDDAKTASKELELTLTGRDCGLDERAPMCGIPYHAAKNYIGSLISKGFKVAICEQVEDVSAAKGIVKRDVVKVYTPGTYTEDSYLDDNQNSYTASIYVEDNIISLAFCDISTGEFYTTECNYNTNLIIDEICKFNPREIVISEELSDELLQELNNRSTFYISHFSNSNFNVDTLDLENQFLNFKNTGLSDTTIKVCNGLVRYIKETQKNSLAHISNIELYNISTYMTIDINSRKNLELVENLRDKGKKGTLLSVIDKTNTSMGGRRIRKWIEEPLIIEKDIINRQSAISEFVNDLIVLEDLKEALKSIYDIERLVGKISSTAINARELVALKNSLSKIPGVRAIISQLKSPLMVHIYNNIDELSDIHEFLEKAIMDEPSISVKEGNIIKSGYNNIVDELRESKTNGKRWLANLESQERVSTGIKSLKISYNKVFGYFIEITKSNLALVPDGRYIRKQTLSNAERYITPELKEVEDKILGAEEKLIALEYTIFTEIREKLESNINRMKLTAKLISEIDCIWSLATVAKNNNYVKPSINNNGVITIADGRHPVVETLTKSNTFISNDTDLDLDHNRLMLITGPNMAGKSTYMRQVALITLMAQIGSFVPAKEANISICDKIFTRIGASDDLAGGKSTFMVEMWEVSNILKNATSKSLVLLDEVGRGTSTYDGLSIAWSVIEYICKISNIKCKTLFATHYHELTKLEGEIPGVKNYSISAKKVDNNIIFLRKIIRGGADESYGIEVAKLAGLPKAVISRAREILHTLEANSSTIEHPTKVMELPMPTAEREVSLTQIGFDDIEIQNLVEEIKSIDVLNLTLMDGFNKLYEIIGKAKKI
ncbi:MAG: DNA mismatch repair protein MutS [Clostridium sp.]|uniref:DNA mismatch repair protein MutS n=1 Tax=Clostridium sp. TaxID=1506 RepID=UPI002FCA0197